MTRSRPASDEDAAVPVSRRRSVGAALATVVLVVAALAAGCGPAAQGQSASSFGSGVRVVAAENFYGNIVKQIGGSHVSVISIISDPNTDPHVYESTPANASALTDSQLVVENGLGYDDFIGKILSTTSSSHRVVLTAGTVLGIHGSDPNPHVWYDTAKLPTLAAAIGSSLARIDPAHAAAYRVGVARFDTSLRPLLAEIASIRSHFAGAPISYTERVPGYLVQAAGLRLATPLAFSLAIEDGTDPSPQSTAEFDADITAGKVRVLLYNSQVVDAQTTQIKQLARSHGVPIVGVSETEPADVSFQTWQLDQDKALYAALAQDA